MKRDKGIKLLDLLAGWQDFVGEIIEEREEKGTECKDEWVYFNKVADMYQDAAVVVFDKTMPVDDFIQTRLLPLLTEDDV